MIQDYVCPIDRHPLARQGDVYACGECHAHFPVIGGVPVLINDDNSVFRVDDYRSTQAYTGASGYGGVADRTSGLRRRYHAFARKLCRHRFRAIASMRQHTCGRASRMRRCW